MLDVFVIYQFENKEDIINKFKKIDWATGQFSGATWWPTCYNYTEEKKQGFVSQFKERKVNHYKGMIEYLGVKKIIPSAGPSCFLQKKTSKITNFSLVIIGLITQIKTATKLIRIARIFN